MEHAALKAQRRLSQHQRVVESILPPHSGRKDYCEGSTEGF